MTVIGYYLRAKTQKTVQQQSEMLHGSLSGNSREFLEGGRGKTLRTNLALRE